MLLLAVCIFACLLFVFCVRKHKKILSVLIAIESVILIAMLAITYLSASGNENVYLVILARAIVGEKVIFGVKISSVIVIQALVILTGCSIAMYGLYRAVRKVLKIKKRVVLSARPENKPILFVIHTFTARKVFRLYCRMNN